MDKTLSTVQCWAGSEEKALCRLMAAGSLGGFISQCSIILTCASNQRREGRVRVYFQHYPQVFGQCSFLVSWGSGSRKNSLTSLLGKKRASLVAQSVKNLPAMQDTWVRFLGREDPLEKEMATHSSILAWRIPWTEEPGRLQSVGSQESDMP